MLFVRSACIVSALQAEHTSSWGQGSLAVDEEPAALKSGEVATAPAPLVRGVQRPGVAGVTVWIGPVGRRAGRLPVSHSTKAPSQLCVRKPPLSEPYCCPHCLGIPPRNPCLWVAAPLFDERAAVVAGKKEVGKYDIPDGNEEGECVGSAGW